MNRIGRLGAPYLDAILLESHGALASVDVRLHRGADGGFIALRLGELVHASISRRTLPHASSLAKTTGATAVYEMLAWSSGSFAVVETNEPVETTVFAAPNDLVLEGLRRLTDSAEIRRRLPPEEAMLETVGMPRGVIATPLSSVELTMLAEIDGRHTLGETIERSILGSALCRHTTLRLIAIGLIRALRSDAVSRPARYDVRNIFPFREALRVERSRRIRSN